MWLRVLVLMFLMAGPLEGVASARAHRDSCVETSCRERQREVRLRREALKLREAAARLHQRGVTADTLRRKVQSRLRSIEQRLSRTRSRPKVLVD